MKYSLRWWDKGHVRMVEADDWASVVACGQALMDADAESRPCIRNAEYDLIWNEGVMVGEP